MAGRLKAEVRRSGKPFKQVVNEYLRQAFAARSNDRTRQAPFKVHPRDVGGLRPGLSLDNIGDLLEATEGPTHR